MRKPMPITQPWMGWVDIIPGPLGIPNSFKSIIGWIIQKGTLQGFWNTPAFATLPPNGQAIQGIKTFTDVMGLVHTLILTQSQAYFLNADGSYTAVGAVFSPLSAAQFSVETITNKAFFINGGAKIAYVDGSNGVYIPATSIGTGYFLGKLASHLLVLNTIEPDPITGASIPYPARVRYSNSGDATTWNGFSAGAFDIADVEDYISGYATLGPRGYVFRSNGITVMTPTGTTTPTFYVENYSIGPVGIGCAYAYTIATIGMVAVFVAYDDVYMMMDQTPPQPIGSNCKKQLLNDLNTRTGQPSCMAVNTVGNGIDFLSYWLFIPSNALSPQTILWIYHFDSKSWVRMILPYGNSTTSGLVAVQ